METQPTVTVTPATPLWPPATPKLNRDFWLVVEKGSPNWCTFCYQRKVHLGVGIGFFTNILCFLFCFILYLASLFAIICLQLYEDSWNCLSLKIFRDKFSWENRISCCKLLKNIFIEKIELPFANCVIKLSWVNKNGCCKLHKKIFLKKVQLAELQTA